MSRGFARPSVGSTSATGKHYCSRPRGSGTTRSLPRWDLPRVPWAPRWRGPGGDWSKRIARRIEATMSHLDEGTLHALLDGELDLHEVKQIQAHIGSCTACGTRLREVKEFHGESDRLVGLLEMPATPSRRTAVAVEDQPEVVGQPAAPAPPPAQRRPPRMSGPAAEPPPLLLPENPEYGRGRMLRRMRWAALVLVTVGA